jgi:hypothetical protein
VTIDERGIQPLRITEGHLLFVETKREDDMNRRPKMGGLLPAAQGAARNGEAIAPVAPESGDFMVNAPPSSSRSDPARAPRRSTVEPARCAGRKSPSPSRAKLSVVQKPTIRVMLVTCAECP